MVSKAESTTAPRPSPASLLIASLLVEGKSPQEVAQLVDVDASLIQRYATGELVCTQAQVNAIEIALGGPLPLLLLQASMRKDQTRENSEAFQELSEMLMRSWQFSQSLNGKSNGHGSGKKSKKKQARHDEESDFVDQLLVEEFAYLRSN